MILYLEFECMLYEGGSLKNKRSVMKRIIMKLRKEFNVSVAELAYHDLWQRSKLGIVTISNSREHAEKTIQAVIRMVDSYPEIERTLTNIEFL